MFTGARLVDAELNRVTASCACFEEGNLTGANLSDANLQKAKLTGAILKDAKLNRINASSAAISDADLTEADLTDAIGIEPDGCQFLSYQAGTSQSTGNYAYPGCQFEQSRSQEFQAGAHTAEKCESGGDRSNKC